jgi:hypothetical protein
MDSYIHPPTKLPFAENEFQRGETAARNAETDLGKRIESLEAFNRPRPLPG